MAYISMEEVSKTYNKGTPNEFTAVKNATLAIQQGAIGVIVGPSGSGKTTLLSLLGCMTRPTRGKITVNGQDVVKLPEQFLTLKRREQFGFIFQQFHLVKDISVLDNVLLPLLPSGLSYTRMKKMAHAVLGKLSLEQKAPLKIKHLSGGEQQRVAIARALINKPAVIIADEPTAHLDKKLAREFMHIIERLHKEGKTIIMASHDPFIFSHPLITQVITMNDGQIEQVGKT